MKGGLKKEYIPQEHDENENMETVNSK